MQREDSTYKICIFRCVPHLIWIRVVVVGVDTLCASIVHDARVSSMQTPNCGGIET